MTQSSHLPAKFYRSEAGREPVRDWLKSLQKHERVAIGEDIAYVQFKWPIGKPRVDHGFVIEEAQFGRFAQA